MSWLVGEDIKLNIIDDTFDCHVIESNGLEGGGCGLIDFKDCSIPDVELIDFSKLEPELELIDFKDFPIPEPELMEFSDPEPEFEYFSKPKVIENYMFLRICTEKPE